MKNSAKVLSLILCLVMLISTFAVIPTSAASTETSTDTSKNDSDILWSVDFDDYDATKQTKSEYLSSKGLYPHSFNGSISNGVLAVTTNQWWHNGAAENDTFRDLFYGLYTDENGKLVDDYYMEIGYTMVSCNETVSHTFTGTENGETVTYVIYNMHRGDSYFNPLSGSNGFDKWLFKVSPTGYLYTAENCGSATFTTADGGNSNISHFRYTKKVGTGSTSAKQPLTEEVWNEMRTNCGTSISTSFNRTHLSGDNYYQIDVGTEYTIRVKFNVASDYTVNATTYIRPVGSTEPFTKVGSTSYQCLEANRGEKTDAIRISENFSSYSFNNITFVNHGDCDGEHQFPVVVESKTNTNGFYTYDKMNCLKCGAIYYSYEKETVHVDADFTDMTSAEYDAFKASKYYNSEHGNIGLVQNEGIVGSFTGTDTASQDGPEILFNLPAYDLTKDYKMSFTAQIDKLPIDQVLTGTTTPGSSFLTDRTGNKHNILLRLGRNADYDSTRNDNEGWLKMRTTSGGTTWANIPSAYTIKEGETYTFTVILKPSLGVFDLYINNEYVGRGGMVTKYWDGVSMPYYRIANRMQIGFVIKNYSCSEIETASEYVLLDGTDMKFNFRVDSNALKFQNDPTYGAIAENVKTPDTNVSSTVYIKDTDLILGSTPYTLSFDFMMTDNGGFMDSMSTDPALWSFISWLTKGSSAPTTTKFGTMVRIGGIDDDETKDGFERFFVVMNNNGAYTSSTDNGNQGYTTSDVGDIAGYYSDEKAVFTFEAGEWVTFTLAVNNVNNSAYFYANGELVGSAAVGAVEANQLASGSLTSSEIRIGDGYRKLHYNWAIKDIDVELTPDRPVELKDSGRLFNMDFGKTHIASTTLKANLGSTAHNAVSATENYKDSATEEGYSRFVGVAGNYAAGATNLYNLSMTSQIGDGLYYNHLDGSKYSIETTFALLDRAPTQDEKDNLAEYNTANKKSYTLPSTLSGKDVSILRLSKYNDNNNVHLIQHKASGLVATTASSVLNLYIKGENGTFVRPSAWYKESDMVGGKVPESAWVTVEVIVDETNDTYSVFVNGSSAFYKDGNSYKRATDLKMKVVTGENSLTTKFPNAPESVAWLANPRYSTMPRTVTDGTEIKSYGSSGLSIISYIRFFQNALDFSVRNVSVTKIDEGLNFVGTQKKTESETPLAFDLRFVFALDDIYVDGIEYDVTVDIDGTGEGNAQTAVCDTVYKTIGSENGSINAWKYEEGDYFSIFSVNGIELGTVNSVYTFKITPYIKKYNTTAGMTERNQASAKTTHIIKFNGLGDMISYSTENSEWSDIKTTYTTIENVPHKALGRTQMVDGVLLADWSAAGIEFAATCLGDVSVTLTDSDTRLFTVVVDGVESKDVALSDGTNVIATNLPYGDHTFKVMNQTGYSGKIGIAGVTIRGTYKEAPADSTLFIEYIGDSITHGCGLGSAAYSDGTNDGTLTYAFISAQELGADYTIMANGGMGVKWGGDYDGSNVNRSMAKYPYLNDAKRGDTPYTGYTRAADIVVIGLSTNDNYRFLLQHNAAKNEYLAANRDASDSDLAEYMATWKTAKLAELGAELELLIAKIEEKHGNDVPIILARGMMEKTLENDYKNADTEEEIVEANASIELYHTAVTYMTDLIENQWNGKYGNHVIKVAHLTPDRTGYEGHPKREGAAVQGADLAEFIRTEFPDLVPVN